MRSTTIVPLPCKRAVGMPGASHPGCLQPELPVLYGGIGSDEKPNIGIVVEVVPHVFQVFHWGSQEQGFDLLIYIKVLAQPFEGFLFSGKLARDLDTS